jgi:CBS domain-containing protein
MKVRELMSPNPVCCVPTDTAQKVARVLCDSNVGSVPVVADPQSRELIGMITDRDLCCSVVANGLDPKSTPISKFVSTDPVTCREGENVEKCERAMQDHQIRRIPVVDGQNKVIGIVSQADLALKDRPEKVAKTVTEISRPEQEAPSIAA